MRKRLICYLASLTLAGPAGAAEYENICHDQPIWDRIAALLAKAPNDSLVIRSYALRLGICRLIEEKKITLEQGAEIFEVERQRMVMERAREEEEKKRPRPLLAEDLEPQG
jgi:hypothetical protein